MFYTHTHTYMICIYYIYIYNYYTVRLFLNIFTEERVRKDR